MKVIQQESYTYKDPITEFLECLYVNFDFDGAQQKLRECETVSVSVKFFTVVKIIVKVYFFFLIVVYMYFMCIHGCTNVLENLM